MKAIKRASFTIVLLLTLLLPRSSEAQSYWFNFDNIPYSEIFGNVIISNQPFDDTLFKDIPIGFQFRYMGRSWTRLHIHSDGQIFFGDDPSNFDTLRAIIPFGADLYGDNTHRSPSVSYESCGCAGAVMMKIQYKEFSLKGGTEEDFINFQVWLYESTGMIEFHYGPGNVSSASACFGGQTGPMTGIRTTIPGAEEVLYSLLLTSYSFGPDTSMSPLPVYLEGIPDNGQVYIFEPLMTTSFELHSISEGNPYLVADELPVNIGIRFYKSQPGLTRVEMADLTGRLRYVTSFPNLQTGSNTIRIPLMNLQPGLFFVRLRDGSKTSTVKFLH